MDPAMEFGGYVEPPSHLKTTGSKPTPEGRPAELRTVPDYDYSLFRYSPVAVPWVLLVLVSAAMLLGLTFWQGPFGFKRGRNGLREGTPRDFELDDGSKEDAGIKNSIKGLRAANFVLGICAIIIAVFAIAARPTPGINRVILLFCALLLFALGCTSSVSFALGIDEVHWLKDCPDVTFPTVHWSPVNYNLRSPNNVCRLRESISTAAIVADAAQAMSAFILAFLLVYTTMHANWAWGPGHVPVEKSANQPRNAFPQPSPFTHIAACRRTYVWLAIFLCGAFVLVAFILMLKMHELRVKPKMVDSGNLVNGVADGNSRNLQVHLSGWRQTQNRFRVAIVSFLIAACILSFMDMFVWRRRLISYLLAIFMFWLFVGLIVVFAMDVKNIGDAKKPACPSGGAQKIRCVYWPYYGTVFLDFWCFFILGIYLLWEFVFRVWGTWDTYYFYADSEWLRNHSLFVEQTDREAFDWKRFTMDTGKEYYYSPSLGISTRQRPRNYVDPTN